VLNVSNATITVNELLKCSPDGIVYWAIRRPNFLVPQIPAHKDALVNGRVFIFASTTSAMTSHNMLIAEKYKNAHLFSVFLFVYALQVLKALFYANFHKLG